MQPAVTARTKEQSRDRFILRGYVALIVIAAVGIGVVIAMPPVKVPTPAASAPAPVARDGQWQSDGLTVNIGGSFTATSGTTTLANTAAPHRVTCTDSPVFAGRYMSWRRECR